MRGTSQTGTGVTARGASACVAKARRTKASPAGVTTTRAPWGRARPSMRSSASVTTRTMPACSAPTTWATAVASASPGRLRPTRAWRATVSGTAVRGISQTGTGVHGRGGRLAGLFEGDVEVTGAEGELRPGLSHSNKARVACRPAITSLKRRPPMAPPSTTMSVPLTNDDSSLAR